MDQIPRDIEVAVRSAAEKPRGYAGELSGVYRRAHRRRRQRVAAVAGAFTLLAGLVGGGAALRQRTDATPPYEPAVTAVPGQRLVLSHARGSYVGAEGDPMPVRLSATTQIGEMSVDDHLLTHSVVGGGDYDRAIGLPDGRLVSMGKRGTEVLLTVQAPGGQTLQRAVQRAAEPVSLMAADATTAYLWRPYGLYAYDLAGGLERLVISSDSLELPDDDPAAGLDAADLLGDKLVTAEARRSCRPSLLHVPSLTGLRSLPLASLGCKEVTGIRLSPSTGRVAVSYLKGASEVRVAVLSTEDAAVLADRRVATALDAHVELAWQDERTVRGVAVPVDAKEVQVLRQFTIPT